MLTSLRHWTLALCLLSPQAFGQVENILPTDKNPMHGSASISNFDLTPQKPFTLKAEVNLPTGFRAYGDKISLEIEDPEGFAYRSVKIEPLQTFFDENTQMKKKGIVGSATLIIPMEAPEHLNTGEYNLKVAISYQACTKSYCLFPTKLHLQIPFKFTGDNLTVSSPATPAPSVLGLNFEESLKKGLLWTFLVVFVAGFLTSLTPCIFPIIPITIAVLGRSAHLNSKKKNFLLSVLYVLGIALTYAALGSFAAATGSLFGSFMSHPIVLAAITVVFFTMSLSMFGLFELQAPLFIRRRFAGDLHVHGYHSAFIYGVIAGVVAGPCVGPVLVGVLTFVAKSQNIWLGFWLLFTFSVGMGVLFLAIGFSSQITKLLPRSGAWMDSIKNFFGILMLSAAFYYFGLLVNQRIWDAALGVALVVGGSFFGAFESLQNLSSMGKIKRGFCLALIFIGAAFFTIGTFDLRPYLRSQAPATFLGSEPIKSETEGPWINYSAQALQKAQQDGKSVLVDFGAAWCAACQELDQFTFSKSEFKNASKNFVLMKFDATNESEELTILRKKYNIVGLPTLLLFDSKGNLKTGLTTTEFIEAPELVKKLQQLQ